MEPERLLLIEETFHAALDAPAGSRAAFLAKACGGDTDLHNEVLSLLSFSDAPSLLIDTPPIDIAAEFLFDHEQNGFIGATIGHYKILSKIGAGGMGDVYLAEDTSLERRVAIKVIKKAEFSEYSEQLARFQREARSASSLNHPNIITVHEIGSSNGTQFIATEYIDGITLRKALKDGSLSFDDMLDIAAQVAMALVAAHTAGVSHRDIKPENIMMRADRLVKVLDFGLAKPSLTRSDASDRIGSIANISVAQAETQDALVTSPGLIIGTAAYLSPEQARGLGTDSRSDIWSLGVVMFEMFDGRKPFAEKTSNEVIAAILTRQPEPMSDRVPLALRSIVAKALQKDPGDRYQTAQALLNELNTFRREHAAHDLTVHGGDRASAFSSGSISFSDRATGSAGGFTHRGISSTSSAEYIVGRVREHKAVSIAAIAAVILGLISIAIYFKTGVVDGPVRSIAVMPFQNESGDPNTEYLSDGITDELINSLSRLPGLKVIASGSSSRYKGKSVDPQQAARELGVEAVVTGSIGMRDGSMQISAEVIDARDNSRMWGERFSGDPSEFLQIQGAIMHRVVSSLKVRTKKSGQEQVDEGNTADARAYELLLKGRFHYSKGSEDEARKAIEYYEQAIAIDGNYARAYAATANAYLYLAANGFGDPKQEIAHAQEAARRAQLLDDDLAEVHLAAAGIRRMAWDWAGADREFNRAIELKPSLASVHFGYSFFLTTQGRHDEAAAEMRLARELDPLKNGINLNIGYTLYFAGLYDEALEQYGIGIEHDPDLGSGYYGRGLVYTAQRRYKEAIADYKQMLRLAGDHPGVNCYLGNALAQNGQPTEARAILRRLESGSVYVSPVELAVLYTGLGEKEQAYLALERAYSERDSQMEYLGVEPSFDNFRTEPRFIRLMDQVGLSQ